MEFRDAYGDVGVMIARQHVLQILIRVFQELQLTAPLMRSEALYEYGSTAATDVWDAIFLLPTMPNPTLFAIRP